MLVAPRQANFCMRFATLKIDISATQDWNPIAFLSVPMTKLGMVIHASGSPRPQPCFTNRSTMVPNRETDNAWLCVFLGVFDERWLTSVLLLPEFILSAGKVLHAHICSCFTVIL